MGRSVSLVWRRHPYLPLNYSWLVLPLNNHDRYMIRCRDIPSSCGSERVIKKLARIGAYLWAVEGLVRKTGSAVAAIFDCWIGPVVAIYRALVGASVYKKTGKDRSLFVGCRGFCP